MQLPLVSICIPTYNGATFLEEALDSILVQTYSNIEVIISDDASTDNTLLIVEDFKKRVNFAVSVFKHKPSGIGANWNNCLQYAKGEYIKFLFQDDVLLPDCLLKMVDLIKVNPSVGLVACKRDFIIEEKTTTVDKWIKVYGNLQSQFQEDSKFQYIDKKLFKEEYFMLQPLNKIGEPSTVLFKTNILNEVGNFDENLQQSLDYIFCYRVLKKYSIAIINESLVKFRIHAKQATNVNRGKTIDDYKLYDEILYNEFFSLLHASERKRLALKYSKKVILINRIKNKLVRIQRKIFK